MRGFRYRGITDEMNGPTCIYGNKHLQGIHNHRMTAYGCNPVLSKVRFSVANTDLKCPNFIQHYEASLIRSPQTHHLWKAPLLSQ